MRVSPWIAAGIALLVGHGSADARPGYKERLPNEELFNCSLCPDEGTDRPPVNNPFGQWANDMVGYHGLDWYALRLIDSDGDGISNGAELGDPCGSFDSGDLVPPRVVDISDPSDPESTCTDCGPACVCGDGISGADEECDGDDISDYACAPLGYAGNDGAVCRESCDAVDTSGCFATCGNGSQEPGEECDDGNSDDSDSCTSDCLDVPEAPAMIPSAGGCSTAPASPPLAAALLLLFALCRRREPPGTPGTPRKRL